MADDSIVLLSGAANTFSVNPTTREHSILHHSSTLPAISFFTTQLSPSDVVLSEGRNVSLWSLERDNERVFVNRCSTASQAHGNESIWAISSVPRSRLFVTGGWDNRILIWNAHDFESENPGPSARHSLEGHSDDVDSVLCHSVAPNVVYSCSDDGSCRSWDIESATELNCDVESHSECVNGIAIDPNHQILFSCSDDATVVTHDIRSLEPIASFGPLPDIIESIAFRSSTQNQLIVPSFGGRIHLLDVRMMQTHSTDAKRLQQSLIASWDSGHSGSIYSVSDVASCDLFVTSGFADGCAKAWREDGDLVWDFEVRELDADENHWLLYGISVVQV